MDSPPQESTSSPVEVDDDPYLKLHITEGNMRLELEAYASKARTWRTDNSKFCFSFTDNFRRAASTCFDRLDDKEEDGVPPALRGLIGRRNISGMVTDCMEISYVSLLRKWEETIYFSVSFLGGGIREGACFSIHFKVETTTDGTFVPSPAAELGNLLRLHEPDKDDDDDGDDGCRGSCPICLEEFDDEEGWEEWTREEWTRGDSTCMPCSHAFHCWCLSKWLHKSLTCPICRLNHMPGCIQLHQLVT